MDLNEKAYQEYLKEKDKPSINAADQIAGLGKSQPKQSTPPILSDNVKTLAAGVDAFLALSYDLERKLHVLYNTEENAKPSEDYPGGGGDLVSSIDFISRRVEEGNDTLRLALQKLNLLF